MSGYTIVGLLCSFIVFLALPSVVITVEVNLKIGLLSRVFTSHDRSSHVCLQVNETSVTKIFLPLQPRTLSVPESFLFVSTLDGTMHAVKKQTGEIRWSLKEGENISLY